VSPEVLLCAETQERFCWVVPSAFAEELCGIYNRDFALDQVYPGAGARVIGSATDDGRYVVTWRGETLVDCPVDAITAGRRVERPAGRRAPAAARRSRRRGPEPRAALLRLLGGLHLGSREYLYRHYDSEVQGRTWLRPGEGDAVIVRATADRRLGIAVAVGGNPFWCAADPDLGARHAVAEAARNVAATGARPWALTDCLNFGHPEDPEVMGDLEAAIDGLAAAAQGLGGLAHPGSPLPFVSGNVSLYNQTGNRAVPASPVVMCAGVIRDVGDAVGLALRRANDFLVLVGERREGLSGSSFAREILKLGSEPPPPLDVAREAKLQELAVLAAEGRWVMAAHDLSDGGLIVALTEMMLAAPEARMLGLDLDLGALEAELLPAMFCERPGLVFEVSPERAARLFQAARERELSAWPIGGVALHGRLRARLPGGTTVEWTRVELGIARERALRRLWNEERL
jgi:phosphoribosylformylglycinamidine synthase